MCNACGNHCCGSDEFGACGCDGCFEPECWSDERDDFSEDDYGIYDARPSRCSHRRFECVEVRP
jgi:hypothetical protein